MFVTCREIVIILYKINACQRVTETRYAATTKRGGGELVNLVPSVHIYSLFSKQEALCGLQFQKLLVLIMHLLKRDKVRHPFFFFTLDCLKSGQYSTVLFADGLLSSHSYSLLELFIQTPGGRSAPVSQDPHGRNQCVLWEGWSEEGQEAGMVPVSSSASAALLQEAMSPSCPSSLQSTNPQTSSFV